jgi:hypothetical protein
VCVPARVCMSVYVLSNKLDMQLVKKVQKSELVCVSLGFLCAWVEDSTTTRKESARKAGRAADVRVGN